MNGHGLIVGKFYPPHSGHEHLIRTAAALCSHLTVVVAPSQRESIPLDLRLDWLREIHADLPSVRFVGVYDDVPVDYDDPSIWDAHCVIFREAVGAVSVDLVFSSEAYGPELARRFAADHIPVDPHRLTEPVSGTAVRADPVAHWSRLPSPVRAWFARRVVVVGAESTGTTTMTAALAAHYRSRGGVWSETLWAPEFGRELTELKLAKLRAADPQATVFDLTWTPADFLTVAVEQTRAVEEAARLGSPLVFSDTDALATAVWQERYLGSSSSEVRALARPADLYLLTDHEGVPFDDDGLRDGEHLRAWMTGRFREVLAGQRFVELRGAHEDRLTLAVAACDALIAEGRPLNDPM